MLAELMQKRQVDETEVVIKATHALIDQVGRKKLDDYRIR